MAFYNINSIEKALIFLISILIGLFAIPPLLLLLSPIFLLRQIIKLFAKWLKPDLSEMVSGYSKILAVQDVYTRPKCSGTSSLVFEDATIDMNKIEEIGNKVLSQKRFLRATQLLVKWMGFYFFKDNPNFHLKNHLILHEEKVSEKQFKELGEYSWFQKPYSKEKPLWELHFFERYIPEQSQSQLNNNFVNQQDEIGNQIKIKEKKAMIFLLHHSILDWFSTMDIVNEIYKLRTKDYTNGNEGEETADDAICSLQNNNNSKQVKTLNEKESTKNNKPTQAQIIYFLVKTVLFGPIEIVYNTLLSIKQTLKVSTGIQPLCEHFSFQVRIPLESVREISLANAVRTIPLTMAAFAGALRQHLIDLGLNQLPKEISITGPVPVPGKRPKKLDNYFTIMPLQLPIKEEDPKKRLKNICKSFESMKHSTAPLAYFGMFEVIGSLFDWMVKLMMNFPLGAISYSILPGPTDLNETLGVTISKSVFAGAMPFGPVIMLAFYSISTNGLLHLRVTGDKALFKSEIEIKRFISLIVREIEIFNNGKPLEIYDAQ